MQVKGCFTMNVIEILSDTERVRHAPPCAASLGLERVGSLWTSCAFMKAHGVTQEVSCRATQDHLPTSKVFPAPVLELLLANLLRHFAYNNNLCFTSGLAGSYSRVIINK